jgi:hypothetical protein
MANKHFLPFSCLDGISEHNPRLTMVNQVFGKLLARDFMRLVNQEKSHLMRNPSISQANRVMGSLSVAKTSLKNKLKQNPQLTLAQLDTFFRTQQLGLQNAARQQPTNLPMGKNTPADVLLKQLLTVGMQNPTKAHKITEHLDLLLNNASKSLSEIKHTQPKPKHPGLMQRVNRLANQWFNKPGY